MQPILPDVIDLSTIHILFGILYGVINAFIRLLVLLFTARTLVRTMGSFAVVINGFLFWLLAWISPNTMVIEPPSILWLTIAGMIIAVVVIIMEAHIGLGRPENRRDHTQPGTDRRRDLIYQLPAKRTARMLHCGFTQHLAWSYTTIF